MRETLARAEQCKRSGYLEDAAAAIECYEEWKHDAAKLERSIAAFENQEREAINNDGTFEYGSWTPNKPRPPRAPWIEPPEKGWWPLIIIISLITVAVIWSNARAEPKAHPSSARHRPTSRADRARRDLYWNRRRLFSRLSLYTRSSDGTHHEHCPDHHRGAHLGRAGDSRHAQAPARRRVALAPRCHDMARCLRGLCCGTRSATATDGQTIILASAHMMLNERKDDDQEAQKAEIGRAA